MGVEGLKIYINGELKNTNPNYTGGIPSDGDHFIGSGNQPNSGLNGNIDDVSLWDIVLTDEEIDNLSQSSPIGDEEGLVAYWSFNFGDGEILYDHSGNQNHGTINGAAWQEIIEGCTDSYAGNYDENATSDDGSCTDYPDNGDYSLSFDGENDYIDFGTSTTTEISSHISIVAWFKLNNFNNGLSTLIMKESTSLSDNNAYGINKTYNGNGLDFVIGDGNSNNVVSTQELQPDKWYYLVCTNDGVTSKIYIDGILHDEISSGNPAGPNENLKMGLHSTLSTSDRYWNGAIDNVSLWNVALDQDQIQFYMSNKPAGDEAGLVADWRFNSGAGDMLYDHSGNQNHGTINGSIWSEDIYVPPTPPVPGGNNSLSFDGVDDFVNCGIPDENFNITSDNLSWNFSFKLLQTTSNTILARQEVGGGRQNKWMIFYQGDYNRFGIHVYGPGLNTQWMYSQEIELNNDEFYQFRLTKTRKCFTAYFRYVVCIKLYSKIFE